MAARRKPQRTCAVCRKVEDKRTLTRLVRDPEQGVLLDPSGKRAGRGAYLCQNPACWEKAAQSDVLEKSLRTKLTDEERTMIADHGTQVASRVESL